MANNNNNDNNLSVFIGRFLLTGLLLQAVHIEGRPTTHKPQISIIKYYKHASTRTLNITANLCHNLSDTDNTLILTIGLADGGAHRWELETSPNLCNDPAWAPHHPPVPTASAAPFIFNERRGICSFQLTEQVSQGNPLIVNFLWNDPSSRGSNPILLSASNECVSLCGKSLEWLPYSHSLSLTKMGGKRNSADAIKVFEDTACQSEIHPEVGNGANLVEMTRKNPQNIVRSIRFKWV